jgi:vacuolar-type H+-ATPase subunit I/STV1
MDIETIKQKIKKLLALSKSPNENEAFAALEKAKRLMEEYGLNEQSCIYTSKKVKSTKIYTPWRTLISNDMAWLYNCYKYQDKDDGTFVFTGEEFDVFMAGEMYAYLVKTIDRMAKQNIRKNAKHTFRQSYRLGIAKSISNRIMTLGQSCSWAPQRESKIKAVSDYVKNKVKIAETERKTKGTNRSAIARGFIDADGISLNRQTTGHGGRYLTG